MLNVTDADITQEEFQLFRSLIYRHTGIFLKDAKRALLRGRLMKRLRHYEYETFAHYYRHLKRHDPLGHELQEMINAVTTHKTSFFREPHHFDHLRENMLLPAQVQASRGSPPSLRVWSAGCSSGEEPYSIAITVAANLERLPSWDVKILASDIDTEVLDTARAGIYASESVSELSQPVLQRNFLRGNGDYDGFVRVKPAIASLVRFLRINLLDPTWPFRGKFDAIFCRNVIIYFDQRSQRQVLEHFARCLNPGGLFFAGHSENLFWLANLFEPVGHTVYRLRQR